MKKIRGLILVVFIASAALILVSKTTSVFAFTTGPALHDDEPSTCPGGPDCPPDDGGDGGAGGAS